MAGEVNIVNLADFVKNIKIKDISSDGGSHPNFIHHGFSFGGEGAFSNSTIEPIMEHNEITFELQANNLYKAAANDILTFALKNLKNLEDFNFMEALEDATVESMEGYGNPTTCLVLTPNILMVCDNNPSDIIIYRNRDKNKLLIPAPNKFAVRSFTKPVREHFNGHGEYNTFVYKVMGIETLLRKLEFIK
jgi:hypothetical protein